MQAIRVARLWLGERLMAFALQVMGDTMIDTFVPGTQREPYDEEGELVWPPVELSAHARQMVADALPANQVTKPVLEDVVEGPLPGSAAHRYLELIKQASR
jgi:hypothetical protein